MNPYQQSDTPDLSFEYKLYNWTVQGVEVTDASKDFLVMGDGCSPIRLFFDLVPHGKNRWTKRENFF